MSDQENDQPQVDSPAPIRHTKKIEGKSPTGFFPGFEIKYPEYELITPQTLQSYTVRSLTVEEEEVLKGSVQTPRKLPEHLNSILWKMIVKKPADIQTYSDFLNMVTLKDRDAMVYALYHITYKDIHNYDITCGACGKQFPVSLSIDKAFSIKGYTGDPNEILQKKIEVELPSVDNVVAVIRAPTLIHEQEMLADIMFQTDKHLELGSEILIIDKFVITKSDGKTEDIYERDNIFRSYSSLPSQDRKLITKKYIEEFGQFGIDLKVKASCISCGNDTDIDLDLVHQLFRAIYE